MFKKFFRPFKILFIAVVVIMLLPRSIFPAQSVDPVMIDLKEYIVLNDQEKRLADYKDDEESLKLKLAQLDIINKSRKKNRAGEVKLDILASRVANKACKEAAENKFISHWNMAGEKPYHRYAFAGGNDHVSENVYGEWTSGHYSVSPSLIGNMMKKGHETFMAERPPSDGHKKTVIDKAHNYVGIGFYITGDQFRYNEEFIDRYFVFKDIAREAKVNDIVYLRFISDGKLFPYYIIVYREPFPSSLFPEQLSRKGSYDDYSKELYKDIPAWEISAFKKGKEYNVPLKLTMEGLYYIQIIADKSEITTPQKLNTKGKIIASGIVIKVYR